MIITVLGAGATAACGYPCAVDLFPQIKSFGATLGDDCSLLKRAIDFVLQKAGELDCNTPDELAFQMHQRRIGGPGNYETALKALDYSRIATDAFFLQREHEISPAGMQRLIAMWHDIVGPFRDDWFRQFPPTKHRLVTFNYDRVIELAFSRSFSALRGSRDLLGPEVLNAGLGYFANLEFQEDRFCYLKLHGSVGIEPIGENERFGDQSRSLRQYAGLAGSAAPSDSFYFEPTVDERSGLPKPKVRPLIAFPVDKQRIEGLGTDYALQEYIRAIRPQAERIFSQATQIRIIGYSFAAPDRGWLVDLIRLAESPRVIVHHPDATTIARDLINYDGIANVTAIDGYW